MTRNTAEKAEARAYARRHGVAYRQALAEVRAAHRRNEHDLDLFVTRLLIEAVEGCGIRHWARVQDWDGAVTATITDLGGEVFVLDSESVGDALRDFLIAEPRLKPMDLDSFHADVIVQSALFGGVIYRSAVRQRPPAVA